MTARHFSSVIEDCWKPWFAWFPVRLTHGSDGFLMAPIGRHKTVWLRHIERLKKLPDGYYSYMGLPHYRDPGVSDLFTTAEREEIQSSRNRHSA